MAATGPAGAVPPVTLAALIWGWAARHRVEILAAGQRPPRRPAPRLLPGELPAVPRPQPMPSARAFDRAVAVLRTRDPALFTRLLTEEYQLWLTVTAPASNPPPPDRS